MIKYIVTISLFLASPLFAATYYAGPSGSGSTCSNAAPCTVTGGIAKLSSGDTLILKDGTYTGATNMISEYASGGPVLPPSGTAGNFTIIKAENVGQAIIDAGYNYPAVSNVNTSARKRDYIKFEGIHFRHGGAGLFAWYGDYAWISQCGFEDGMAAAAETETPIAYLSGGSSYGLVEDNWIWGKGRYGFYTGPVNYDGTHVGTNHVIFRRNVVRLDDVPSNWQSASLRFYGSNTNVMQNNIAIDGYFNDGNEKHSFATGGGSSDGDINDAFYGNIALNQPLNNCIWTEKGSGTFPVSNNICWGGAIGLSVSQDYVTSLAIVMQNNTIGQNSNLGLRRHGYAPTVSTTRDLYFIPNAGTAFDGGAITEPEYVYLATGGLLGTADSGSATTITSATQSTLTAAGLAYLPRLEASSTLSTANVGATVMYQIGGTGTFHGDTNWNTTTTEHLWPYPNEAVWAAKMKAYTASGPGGNRGFAALSGSTSTPLTDYVWSYLGNSKPADIYDGAALPDYDAPVTSINKSGRYTTSQTVTISATDNIGVTSLQYSLTYDGTNGTNWITGTTCKALVNRAKTRVGAKACDAAANCTINYSDLSKQRRK